MGIPILLKALRHRNFQLFFTGQLVSLIGTWMQTVAQAWLVYRLTGSPFLLGLVGFASQFPVFLVGPVGGLIVDHYDRRYVVLAAQVASMILAFVLALLTLTGSIQVWHIFVLAILLGTVNAFDNPARQSFLVEMVGRDDLMNAIALNSTMFNSARLLGPAIAGILVAEIGEGWCFFANGLSYLAGIAGLLMMRLPVRERTRERTSPMERLTEGARFVWRTGPIRDLLALLGLSGLVVLPFTVLMPLFADRVLHSGARGLGFLMAATGLGAVLGTLTLAAKCGTQGLERWVLFSCTGCGLILILFACSSSFWLSTVLLVPVGYCMLLQMSSSNTLIQAMVPDKLRGRVMAVYAMMFMGMPPIGALLEGSVADRLGPQVTVVCGATLAVSGALVFGFRMPRMRAAAAPLIVAQAGSYPSELLGDRSKRVR
jgi:MFS family permease